MATKPIVADGGIRHHGDIAKSVRFGAAMVMVGSLFAGHEESPGQTVEVDGKLYKEYYGSASGLQQGRVQARRRQAHPGADQGLRWPTRCARCAKTCKARSATPAAAQLADLRKVNYVVLGGENAGEHFHVVMLTIVD